MCYFGVLVYGFVGWVEVDCFYMDFGEILCELYCVDCLIVVLCVVGIVICSLVLLL